MSAGSVDDVRIGFTPQFDQPIGPDMAQSPVIDVRAQWGNAVQPGVSVSFDAKGPAVQPVINSEDIGADLNKQNPGMPIEQSAAAVGNNLSLKNEGLLQMNAQGPQSMMTEGLSQLSAGVSELVSSFFPQPEPTPQLAMNRFAPQPQMTPAGGSMF